AGGGVRVECATTGIGSAGLLTPAGQAMPLGRKVLIGQELVEADHVDLEQAAPRRRPESGMGDDGDIAVGQHLGDERFALGVAGDRSEEHTSELQSRFDLVCRLLLEKKKDS